MEFVSAEFSERAELSYATLEIEKITNGECLGYIP